MKKKNLLYPNEQKLIREKLINILELDEYNSITLYELENHTTKTKKIMELLPEIRKFCSMSKIKAFSTPEKVDRPCKGLWNRDVNSSLNIFNIVENKIAGKERPVYLQRKQIVSNTTSVLQNQILDEDEKPQL